MEKNDFYRLMQTSKVLDNKLIFSEKLSSNDLIDAYKFLSDDLYSANIPNWRVVGFTIPGSSFIERMVVYNHCFDMNTIEVMHQMRYIIGVEHYDDNGAYGFYCPDIDEDVNPKMERPLDCPLPKDCLAVSRKEISAVGYLGNFYANVFNEFNPCFNPNTGMIDIDEEIWIHNITRISQEENSGYVPMVPAKFLLKDKYICNANSLLPTGGSDSGISVFMFMMKGTGRRKYQQNMDLINIKTQLYVPTETDYSLTDFLALRCPDGDNLEFTYIEDINEDYLTMLLQDYGRSFYVSNTETN